MHHRIFKYVIQMYFSGYHSVEFHGMKLDNIHDVLQIDILQIYNAGVGFFLADFSVGSQMLVCMLKEEVVYLYIVFFDNNFCRVNTPYHII